MKKITGKNYNLDFAKLLDKNLLFEIAKERYFDEKALDKKTVTDISLITFFQSQAIMAGSLKKSKEKVILQSLCLPNPKQFYVRLILLLQKKVAGKKSDINTEETAARAYN